MEKEIEIKRLTKVRNELYKQVAHINLNDYEDRSRSSFDVDLTEHESDMILRIEALTEIINDLEIGE